MEQKDIDIYEILKDVPKGTEFYTSLCGNVGLAYLESNKEAGEAIWTKNKDGEYSFNKNGRWMKGGEVTFFPSKQMRDWSKFFKKGDVLEYKKENNQATCIFDSYEDNTTKLHFTGLYTLTKGKIWDTPTSWATFDWVKSDNPAAYIKTIEERLGGKLNRKTLEIEKPAKLTFEIGKLYVFREEDEDGELTIIGKLIDKNESEDTLTFGNQYEIENEKFVTDQTFDLRISVNKELREATEGECCTFQEACTLWEKSKEKKSKEQPAFKTFDKVMVRDGKEYEWLPALFVRDRGEGANYRYEALSIQSGKTSGFSSCIQFEGHENIAFTDYDIENLPF
nr:MAG TPA: hypothetical protein [Caudoviricetes sp.]